MNDRSRMISKLLRERDARKSYIRSKLSVLLPAQIRSLRLRRNLTQTELGAQAEMKQARISAVERIGEAAFSVETLIRLASALQVGLAIKFVSMSEMLEWENDFTPDEFDALPLEKDEAFLRPARVESQRRISAGLSDAMLGAHEDAINMATAYMAQGESASLWRSSFVGPSLPANETSNTSGLRMQLSSVAASATSNQNAREQGQAA